MALVAAAYVHNVRWDLSTGDRFTLSDHARQVLRELDKPVKIRASSARKTPAIRFLKDLLWQVAARTADQYDDRRREPQSGDGGPVRRRYLRLDGGRERTASARLQQSERVAADAAVLNVMQSPKKIYALDRPRRVFHRHPPTATRAAPGSETP